MINIERGGTKIKIGVSNHNLKEYVLTSLKFITKPKQRKDTIVISIFQRASSALFFNQMVGWIMSVHAHPQDQVN